jgi:hypothetical protein
MLRKFWIVWRQGGAVPTFPHPTPHSAHQEAARLAAANPGQKFTVLESVSTAEVPISWKEHGSPKSCPVENGVKNNDAPRMPF